MSLSQALTKGTRVSPVILHDSDALAILFKVVGERSCKKTNRNVKRVLIQWNAGTKGAATWEDRDSLVTSWPSRMQCKQGPRNTGGRSAGAG
jgi:hypothetical protein